MAIDINPHFHLRGGLATGMQRWLAEELRALDEVELTDYWPDYDVVFGGGVLQAEGYRDATFVLVTLGFKAIDRQYVEETIPTSVDPADRLRLVARLTARQHRYSGIECRPPVRSRVGIQEAVRTLDSVVLGPQMRRSGR